MLEQNESEAVMDRHTSVQWVELLFQSSFPSLEITRFFFTESAFNLILIIF